MNKKESPVTQLECVAGLFCDKACVNGEEVSLDSPAMRMHCRAVLWIRFFDKLKMPEC